MSIPSPYEILGVAPSASLEEIKVAYRRPRATHPDLGGSEEKFRQVQQAFQDISEYNNPISHDQTFQKPGEAPRAGFTARPYDERLRTTPQEISKHSSQHTTSPSCRMNHSPG